MASASLLLVVLTSVMLQLPDAARTNPEQSLQAAPSATAVNRPINLSLPERIHSPAMLPSGMAFSPRQSDAAQSSWAHAGISIGPLRTEFGGTTGRHMHLATMKLEGVSIFGGSVGGSIDSRSARITLSWPSGN